MIDIVFNLFALLYIYAIFMLSQAVLYVFQIKEYRFDRIFSLIREDGWINLIKKNFGRRSAITQRNILIVLIALSLFITGYLTYRVVYYVYFDPCPPTTLFPTKSSEIRVCDTSLVWKAPTLSEFVLAITEALLIFGVVVPFSSIVTTTIGAIITEPLARIKRNKLIILAREKVKHSKAVFIGISGTYGKSTTKEYLYHILSKKYKVGKTDENMNTDVGVAVSILRNLKPDTEYFVTEVGAYKLGEVRRAAAIFNPRAAIMLPFGNQHIDLFGSKENLVVAESEILEFIPKDGTIYANADIPELQYVLDHSRGAVIKYSITKKADIYATDIKTTGEGSSAKISYSHLTFTIETKLLGKHVIQNLLPAIAAAIDYGMTTGDVAAAIATLPFVPGKLSLHEKNGAVILNDAGNTSLNGFLAAIDTIKLFNKEKVFILSKGIIELGSEKKESYKKIIMQIEKDNIGLATSDKLFKQFDSKNNVTIVRNEDEFTRFIVSKLGSNTAVLLEGKFTIPFIDKLI